MSKTYSADIGGGIVPKANFKSNDINIYERAKRIETDTVNAKHMREELIELLEEYDAEISGYIDGVVYVRVGFVEISI